VAIRTRTLADLNRSAFEAVLRQTNGRVSLFSPGSTVRALLETANRHLEGFYESLSANHAMAFLSQATGPYLDLHGSLFGMDRIAPQIAVVRAEDHAIRFYVATGTLYDRLPKTGDLNHGLIPAGTTISSSDGTIVYTVDTDVTFERTAKEVFAPASASDAGVEANVGAHTLQAHNLGLEDVLVTNPISIQTGLTTETDEAFRGRISQRVLSSQGGNETAIRLTALSSPGVADVIIDEYAFGAGSFRLVLIPLGNRVPVEVLRDVRRRIESTVAFGTYFQLEEPKYRRFSTIIKLVMPNATAGVLNLARNAVQREVLGYLGDIRPGGTLIIREMQARIQQAHPDIRDSRIEALCVGGRQQLLHNISLNSSELFLPDTGLSDPVRVI